jgi:NADH-quinone oxidoreductase subunit E
MKAHLAVHLIDRLGEDLDYMAAPCSVIINISRLHRFLQDDIVTLKSAKSKNVMTVLEILKSIKDVTPGDLIPILQKVQDHYGYLPQDVLEDVSKHTSIPISRIYGVATFYEQFYLKPRGRHMIKCCRGTACHVNRVSEIVNTISEKLKIPPNQTTDDMRFTFETVACLGTCFLAPVMMVDKDYYGNLKPDQISKILEKYE